MKLLATVVVICATGSLMSMEEDKKSRLNFGLDNALCIQSYSKQNMSFYKKSSEWLGKNILDVLPLERTDRDAIVRGFADALYKKETVKVPYTLDQMHYVAKITALKTANKGEYNYFVKATQAKQDNQ